jgi:hypothetical protein
MEEMQLQIDTLKLEIEALKNKVEHWGDPHEYLNGKHLKDWESKMLDILEEALKAARKGSVSNSSGN